MLKTRIVKSWSKINIQPEYVYMFEVVFFEPTKYICFHGTNTHTHTHQTKVLVQNPIWKKFNTWERRFRQRHIWNSGVYGSHHFSSWYSILLVRKLKIKLKVLPHHNGIHITGNSRKSSSIVKGRECMKKVHETARFLASKSKVALKFRAFWDVRIGLRCGQFTENSTTSTKREDSIPWYVPV